MIGRVALGIAVLALVVGLGLAVFFGDELRTIGSLLIMRLMLDYARNVDEAFRSWGTII